MPVGMIVTMSWLCENCVLAGTVEGHFVKYVASIEIDG